METTKDLEESLAGLQGLHFTALINKAGGLVGHPSKSYTGLEEYTNDEVDNQVGILPVKMVQGGTIDRMRTEMRLLLCRCYAAAVRAV